MKILMINGSPQGVNSSSKIMLSALVRDVQNEHEIVNITLAEKELYPCRGCYSCWANNRGCVIEDDFSGIIKSAENTDLIVFATPVYFGNVSGLFKNFIDRLTSTGNPHADVKLGAPKFVMVANCGFPDEKQFEVISLWINKFVASMRSELLGEYYFPAGKRLKDENDEQAQLYLQNLALQGPKILARMR